MGKWRRSGDKIGRLVQEFEIGGETRREFCQGHDIALTTLDFWRRARTRRPRLLPVEVMASEPAAMLTLVLANGRKIESSGRFADGELVRLIRIAESA